MFKHLFKLIWNKKKQNALLITEMFVSFLVLFAVFSMVVYFYKNYNRPQGFNHNNVWVVTYATPQHIQRPDSVALFTDKIRNVLKGVPQVKEMSFTASNVPFAMSTSTTGISSVNKKGVMTNSYTAELAYKDVLDLQVVEGRWFSEADRVGKLKPLVVNKKLANELFGNESAVGKVLGDHDQEKKQFDARFKIVGVVEDAKDKGDYQAVENGLYQLIDSNSLRWNSTILLKLTPDVDAAFESRLFKTLHNVIGSSIEIEHLEKKRIAKNKIALVPMIILLIVGGFLIINVALGLFGVLWYNINKRRGEIGLRRAVGASGNAVSLQLVGEALVLSTLSVLLGFFFAVQFPLLNVFDLPASVYLASIGLSVMFIYILVFLCAMYPGKQAAAILPAVALHEE